MKLDKIKFAKLINYLSSFQRLEVDQIEVIDDLIDIDVPEPPPAVSQAIKPSDIDALLDAMFGDSMIEAIKRYRHLTGLPLKDAKVAIEAVIEKYWTRS